MNGATSKLEFVYWHVVKPFVTYCFPVLLSWQHANTFLGVLRNVPCPPCHRAASWTTCALEDGPCSAETAYSSSHCESSSSPFKHLVHLLKRQMFNQLSSGSRAKLLLFSCQDLKRISKAQWHALDWQHKRAICLHKQASCRLFGW